MQIIKLNNSNINLVVSVLKKGGLVIMPTETLYGAFVDATNSKAVIKLNEFKARPFGKPYSVAVKNQKMAEQFVELNMSAKNIYKNFLPGPITVISKSKHKVAPGIESENGSLGIRIPDYKFVLTIIEKLNKPITATSANASYKKRPYKINDILDNISDKQKSLVDLIVDAGTLPKNEPSTVIDTTLDDSPILRQGDIKISKTEGVLSRSEENTKNIAKEIWQKYENYKGKRAIVFALTGKMGAGKTIFTKGLAQAIGITETIVSPTYSLQEEYGNDLVHIDAWRMENGEELKTLGFLKKILDKNVIAIEWADRVSEEIRKYNEEAIIIWIKIEYGKSKNERTISWQAL